MKPGEVITVERLLSGMYRITTRTADGKEKTAFGGAAATALALNTAVFITEAVGKQETR